jgi:hypothetical protein
MQPPARVAGVDDGPYVRGSEKTPIIITIMRLDGYIEGFLSACIATDGTDSSEIISETLNNSRFATQIRAIMSDGACLGGFNVLDLEDLNSACGVPVVTCSDEEPDTPSVRRALESNFDDWEYRLDLIKRWDPEIIELGDGICFVRYEGTTKKRAEWLARKLTIRGRTPEPIRISHMAAGALFKNRGEIDGR